MLSASVLKTDTTSSRIVGRTKVLVDPSSSDMPLTWSQFCENHNKEFITEFNRQLKAAGVPE